MPRPVDTDRPLHPWHQCSLVAVAWPANSNQGVDLWTSLVNDIAPKPTPIVVRCIGGTKVGREKCGGATPRRGACCIGVPQVYSLPRHTVGKVCLFVNTHQGGCIK